MERKETARIFAMALQSADAPRSVQAKEIAPASFEEWFSPEGQLAVDVAESGNAFVIVSTMAGATPEHIQVFIHHDLLTIRGIRTSPLEHVDQYIYQECFWGKFSRSIVLPSAVKGELATASYANGVLSIRIPKRSPSTMIPIRIVDA